MKKPEAKKSCDTVPLRNREARHNAEAISKNYCETNSGSPEVELRFFPWIILFKY
jgi:hypothetical protein